jgi:hypothetical protein
VRAIELKSYVVEVMTRIRVEVTRVVGIWHRAQVPFYFQETLGGADINGNDTLRGFVDYRFRGASRILFQAEYRHGIWGPLGFLSFYDLGRVAQRPSDISFDHTRHDIGVGLTISATNRVVTRMYVGFGTGEGIRPNYKFGGAL